MKEEKYIITYVNAVGELMTIQRTETEKELKERIDNYKKNNFKIIKILKEVITTSYVEVEY